MKLNDFQRKHLQKALANPQLSGRNRVRIGLVKPIDGKSFVKMVGLKLLKITIVIVYLN
jgi:hypothetical protein